MIDFRTCKIHLYLPACIPLFLMWKVGYGEKVSIACY